MKKYVKKSTPPAVRESSILRKPRKPRKTKPSREPVQSMRGVFKSRGLLEGLMEEKKREREL